MKHTELLSILAVGIAYVIWGTSNSIFKVALESLHPFVFGYFRFMVSGLVLAFILLIINKKPSITFSDFKKVAWISFFGIFLKIAILLFTLPHVSVIFVSLIFAVMPVINYVLSLVFFKEPFAKKTFFGMMIALIGLLIAISGLFDKKTLFINEYSLLIIIVALLEAWFMIQSKRTLSHIDSLGYTTYTFLLTALFFFIPAFYIMETDQIIITTQSLFALLYAIVGSSIFAYFLYAFGLKHMKGNKASILGFIDPLSAFIAAPILLGEYPTTIQYLGLSIMIIGIFIAEHNYLHMHGHKHPLHNLK